MNQPAPTESLDTRARFPFVFVFVTNHDHSKCFFVLFAIFGINGQRVTGSGQDEKWAEYEDDSMVVLLQRRLLVADRFISSGFDSNSSPVFPPGKVEEAGRKAGLRTTMTTSYTLIESVLVKEPREAFGRQGWQRSC